VEELSIDVCVIGSGPAGQKAAIQASKLGKSVVVLEKAPDPGGQCLYSGTIPSKSLREAIIDLTRFNERGFFQAGTMLPDVSFADLNSRLSRVIEEERNLVYRQFKKNNIRLIEGTARFENPHMLIVVDHEYRLLFQIKANYFIIATGSQPRNPNNIIFDSDVILDSTRLLGIKTIPNSMLVLG